MTGYNTFNMIINASDIYQSILALNMTLSESAPDQIYKQTEYYHSIFTVHR